MSRRKEKKGATPVGAPAPLPAQEPLAPEASVPEQAAEVEAKVEGEGAGAAQEPSREADAMQGPPTARDGGGAPPRSALPADKLTPTAVPRSSPPAPSSSEPPTAPTSAAEAPAPSLAAAPPPEREPAPVKVGAILRCMKFEGERGVAGRVESIHSTEPMILLFLLGLDIYWPITFADVRGDTWAHNPSNYPPPGVDADFDARCRTAHPAKTNPLLSVDGRRPARRGYCWARVTTNLGVIGFTLAGEEKARWRGPAKAGDLGDLGEFPQAVVKDNPSCFDSAIDEADKD